MAASLSLPGFCASPYPDSLFILQRAINPCVVDLSSLVLVLFGLIISIATVAPRIKHTYRLKEQV